MLTRLGRALVYGFALLWWWLPIGDAAAGAAQVSTPERVTLQLKWKHQFQFAGYYAAIAQGYYRDAGLDVQLLEAQPDTDPVQQVLDGSADFGVGTSALLLSRYAGKPVVVLANVFQHSALALVMREDSPTDSIHSLAGRTLMLEAHADELLAYLRREGVDPASLHYLPHHFDAQDLIDGRVDAMSVYLTDEPFFLDQAGFRYLTFTPRSAGIDFYGDNLFTSEQQITLHPQRVRAFRAASLRGWDYALRHPDEIIELILSQYSQRHSRAQLAFEAQQMQALIRDDLVELGYSHPGRWRHIADTYAELGLLPRGASIEGLLYQPHPQLPAWLPRAATGLALLLLAAGLFSIWLHRLNRRLRRQNHALETAQARLLESESRYRLLAEHATDMIWTLELADAALSYFSPSLLRCSGYTPQALNGATPEQLFCPESAARVRDYLAAIGDAALPATLAGGCELEMRSADGHGLWTETSLNLIRDLHGRPLALMGISRDISERRLLHARLDRLAHFDQLTGLPNRTLFFDRLERTLAAASRDRQRCALLYLDLDGFKAVNDNGGHADGDRLLKSVAERLLQCSRAADTVARLGGDEFAVILRDIAGPGSAAMIAERIIETLAEPVQLSRRKVRIGCSIGIALYPDHARDPETLLTRADAAMYAVKRSGRQGWRYCDSDDDAAS